MDPAQLGNRLRAARQNRDLNQDDVAKALDLPRTAIVKIESGERSVSTLELANLAELYGRPIGQFFAEEVPQEEEVLVALYRLDPALSKEPEVHGEVLRVVSLYQEGVSLKRILGRSGSTGPPSYSLRSPQNAMEAILQGTGVAEEERERLGLGKAPVSDMAELVSGEGVWASGLKLPDAMSGFFLCHPAIGMAIAVNYDHSRQRKRFSYAHEYAHALLDRDQHATVSTRENSRELTEKRANAFAAAFLMPKAGVKHQLHRLHKGLPRRFDEPMYSVADDAGIELKGRSKSPQDLTYQEAAHIAHHFGVSYQAGVYRLLNLDEIRKSNCEALLKDDKIEFANRYMRLLEELSPHDGRDAPHRELMKQVYLLAVEAYRREEISRGRLRDIAKKLGRDGKELLTYAEAVRGS